MRDLLCPMKKEIGIRKTFYRIGCKNANVFGYVILTVGCIGTCPMISSSAIPTRLCFTLLSKFFCHRGSLKQRNGKSLLVNSEKTLLFLIQEVLIQLLPCYSCRRKHSLHIMSGILLQCLIILYHIRHLTQLKKEQVGLFCEYPQIMKKYELIMV